MTGCAMHWEKLKSLELTTLICEEAGEVMEAQFLCALFPSIEHCISIGDPLQLRYVHGGRSLITIVLSLHL